MIGKLSVGSKQVVFDNSALNAYEATRTTSHPITNLFNKSDPDVIVGTITDLGVSAINPKCFRTGFIPCTVGDYFIFPKSSDITVTTQVDTYTVDKVYTGGGTYEDVGDGTIKFTISPTATPIEYVLFNGSLTDMADYMVVKNQPYPTEYVPYDDSLYYTLNNYRLNTAEELKVIDIIEKNRDRKYNCDWIIGDVSAGLLIRGTKRITQMEIQHEDVDIVITADWKFYKVYLWTYADALGTTPVGMGWTISDLKILAGTYYRIVIARLVNEVELSTAYGEFYNSLSIRSDLYIEDVRDRLVDLEFIDHPIKAINHRGYNTIAPENTIEAYKLSKLKGFKYVETDVQFTADNVAVLTHNSVVYTDGINVDPVITAPTGAYITPVTIAETTYATLVTYDWGSWRSSDYTGVRISKFEDFILVCRNIGLHPYIEIKAGTQAQIEGLVATVKKYGMLRKVTWISFTDTHLTYIKGADAKARLGLVCDTITSTIISTATSLVTSDNDVFINASYSAALITDTTVSLCSNANLPLEVWCIDAVSYVQSCKPYVTGITSNILIAGKVLTNSALQGSINA